MGIFNKLYRDIFCEQFMYGTHNSSTKLLRTQVVLKERTHILCTYSVVKGDGRWWQSCRSTSIWFTPGRRLFFFDYMRAMLVLKLQYWLKFGRDSEAEFWSTCDMIISSYFGDSTWPSGQLYLWQYFICDFDFVCWLIELSSRERGAKVRLHSWSY